MFNEYLTHRQEPAHAVEHCDLGLFVAASRTPTSNSRVVVPVVAGVVVVAAVRIFFLLVLISLVLLVL